MSMTIDERLEKLVERHEALAQTVELMAAENRERDRRWDERHGAILEMIEKLLHIFHDPHRGPRALPGSIERLED